MTIAEIQARRREEVLFEESLLNGFCRDCSRTYSGPETDKPVGTVEFSFRGSYPEAREVCRCGAWVQADSRLFYDAIGFDLNTTDSANLQAAMKRCRVMFPQVIADKVRKHLRLILHENRKPRGFDWTIDLPKSVRAWADSVLDELVSDPCRDNFRVAEKGDRRQVRAYRKQQKNGCCGSIDVQRKMGGKIYLLGLNYGH